MLEERLSSLLQVLIGQVARIEQGGSATAWQALPIDSETVNALGCLLTGPSLRESSLAAGAVPGLQAKAAERRLQQSLARKALQALEDTVAVMRRVLGPAHPDTSFTQRKLERYRRRFSTK